MVYNKIPKHKKNINLILNTYDTKCPKPAYSKKNVKQGVGCVICNVPPIYCPYFDKGKECVCDVQCDFHYKYEPTIIYKTKQSIIIHLESHNLQITDEILNFYNLE